MPHRAPSGERLGSSKGRSEDGVVKAIPLFTAPPVDPSCRPTRRVFWPYHESSLPRRAERAALATPPSSSQKSGGGVAQRIGRIPPLRARIWTGFRATGASCRDGAEYIVIPRESGPRSSHKAESCEAGSVQLSRGSLRASNIPSRPPPVDALRILGGAGP